MTHSPTFYYTFASEAEANGLIEALGVTTVAIDVVGLLFNESGEQSPGWHVNTSEPIEAWELYRGNPKSPKRVFA